MCSNAAKEDAFNFQWGGSIKVTGGPEAFRTKQGTSVVFESKVVTVIE